MILRNEIRNINRTFEVDGRFFNFGEKIKVLEVNPETCLIVINKDGLNRGMDWYVRNRVINDYTSPENDEI